MANYVVSDTSLGSVADAIRTKGGTSAPLTYPQGFIDAIDAISGGGDEPIPDDGKTRIWISIAEGTPDNRLTFYLRFTASEANNTTVDWGDGVSETLGSTTATNYSHKYAQGGDYVIVMTVNSGTISFIGNSAYAFYGSTSATNAYNRVRINRIILGDAVSGIGDYAFYNCYVLPNIVIPNGITSIGGNVLRNCYGLTSVTIPSSVTSIGVNAFNNSTGMSEYHFKPTTPPTLANTNAFGDIPSDCIIYVPQGSLNAYKTATNWSQFSSKMQEEPT
jgi:hypothetical protein